jgi:hypothetical protein
MEGFLLRGSAARVKWYSPRMSKNFFFKIAGMAVILSLGCGGCSEKPSQDVPQHPSAQIATPAAKDAKVARPTSNGPADIDEVTKRVDDVTKTVDAIDQPIGETCEQRLRRLGLKPENVGLTPEQAKNATSECKPPKSGAAKLH